MELLAGGATATALWVLLTVAALDLVIAGILISLTIDLSVEGRGEPDGLWILGGGAKLGPVALTAAAARGVPGGWHVHVFGRQVFKRSWDSTEKDDGTASEPKASAEDVEEEAPEDALISRVSRRLRKIQQRVLRFFDLEDLVGFAWLERRRIEVNAALDVEYSFRDIITTGKLMGALYAASGWLAPVLKIRQRASWQSVNRGKLELEAKVRVWPVLLALEFFWFVARHLKWRRPQATMGDD